MKFTDIVSNVKIYDLEESIIASGYPMRTKAGMREVEEKDINRGEKLVRATLGGNTAHHQFLTGIRVNFDLTFTNKAWVEAERYRFLEFVSSQSTMHRITKFNLDEAYCKYVDPRMVEIMKEKVAEYNALENYDMTDIKLRQDIDELRKEKYLGILYSNPCGFKLTAGMTTNYRQLKTIYAQRKLHRLPEWRELCAEIEKLPMFKELCLGGESDG